MIHWLKIQAEKSNHSVVFHAWRLGFKHAKEKKKKKAKQGFAINQRALEKKEMGWLVWVEGKKAH